MKKKKETKKKEFTLKEGEKLLAIGDQVLFMGKSLVDKTEVVSVETDTTEFPYALLKNGVRVRATYMKKEKELFIQSQYVSRDKAYVWGKVAKELWENYQLSVKFNQIKAKLNKVDFDSLDKEILIEVLPLFDKLLNPNKE